MLSPCAVGGEMNGKILEGLLSVEVGKCPSEESIKYLNEKKKNKLILVSWREKKQTISRPIGPYTFLH